MFCSFTCVFAPLPNTGTCIVSLASSLELCSPTLRAFQEPLGACGPVASVLGSATVSGETWKAAAREARPDSHASLYI